MQMKQTIAFTYDFKACILLGIRHLQFSFLDFDMYFCISPDIHISIPMTVFFRNRLLNFPRKRRMNIVQNVKHDVLWKYSTCSRYFQNQSSYLNSMLTIVLTAYLILESSLTLLIFSSVLKLTCRLFYTLYWPSSLYFLILFAGENFYPWYFIDMLFNKSVVSHEDFITVIQTAKSFSSVIKSIPFSSQISL